jgi:hypothetical protein
LTAAGQLRLAAHLSRWLAAKGLDASALTVPVVERYFVGRRLTGYANERTSTPRSRRWPPTPAMSRSATFTGTCRVPELMSVIVGRFERFGTGDPAGAS